MERRWGIPSVALVALVAALGGTAIAAAGPDEPETVLKLRVMKDGKLIGTDNDPADPERHQDHAVPDQRQLRRRGELLSAGFRRRYANPETSQRARPQPCPRDRHPPRPAHLRRVRRPDLGRQSPALTYLAPCLRARGDMSKPKVTALEFKHTLLPEEEPRVQEELGEARVTPVRRRVYFFDTPGRHLAERKLFVRARTTEGDDDDSTVKLRSLTLPDVPKLWRADDVRIETDIVGAKQIDSAKLDHDPHGGLIELVESRALEPAIVLGKAQRAIVKAALPSGASLKDLEVLGPVDARKWKLEPNGFPYELAVEEWTLPDASRFIELSFKVKPKEQERAARAFDSLLGRLKIERNREQDPKTQMVIDFFADRL